MSRLYFQIGLVLLSLFCLFDGSSELSHGASRGMSFLKSGPRKGVYNGLGYANGDYQMKQASDAKPMQSKPSRGVGLSAWGIIAVLAGSLLLGTVLYYTVLFYPILCKKERKIENHRTMDCCPSAPPATFSTPV